jgi:hypothetical protein
VLVLGIGPRIRPRVVFGVVVRRGLGLGGSGRVDRPSDRFGLGYIIRSRFGNRFGLVRVLRLRLGCILRVGLRGIPRLGLS